MRNFTYASLRFMAILKKELLLMKRDAITYFLIICIPFAEVILFGYIIKTDAKHLPTIVVATENTPFTNSLIQAFKDTEYFSIKSVTNDPAAAEDLINKNKIQFIIHIPQNFSRDLIRNQQPHILLEGDATDPASIGSAFNAANMLPSKALIRDTQGVLKYLQPGKSSFVVDTHAKYNPATLSQYHTLPGLIVTILTLTLIMLTAISITTEFEFGTMETLLITPLKPLEMILGKIIPQLFIGYCLMILTLFISYFLFHVPFYGSVILLFIVAIPFLIANLGIGIATSTISKTQFQAVNIANTYVLPAILFSGFMFPFYAMPTWAQWVGNLLPSTHFLRITSGIMLKDAGFSDIWPDLWPILIFMVIIIFISFKFYRKTLD
jgi:ABC-2 type transport system permease protein